MAGGGRGGRRPARARCAAAGPLSLSAGPRGQPRGGGLEDKARFLSPARVISPARPRHRGPSPPLLAANDVGATQPIFNHPPLDGSADEFAAAILHQMSPSVWAPPPTAFPAAHYEHYGLAPPTSVVPTRRRRPGLRAGMVVASIVVAAATRVLHRAGGGVAELLGSASGAAELLRALGVTVGPAVAAALEAERVRSAEDLLRCSEGDLRELGLRMGERNRVRERARTREGQPSADEAAVEAALQSEAERLRGELAAEASSAEQLQSQLESVRLELRRAAAAARDDGQLSPPPLSVQEQRLQAGDAAPDYGPVIQQLREELAEARSLAAAARRSRDEAEARIGVLEAQNDELRRELAEAEEGTRQCRLEAEMAEQRAAIAESELANALKAREALQQQLYDAEARRDQNWGQQHLVPPQGLHAVASFNTAPPPPLPTPHAEGIRPPMTQAQEPLQPVDDGCSDASFSTHESGFEECGGQPPSASVRSVRLQQDDVPHTAASIAEHAASALREDGGSAADQPPGFSISVTSAEPLPAALSACVPTAADGGADLPTGGFGVSSDTLSNVCDNMLRLMSQASGLSKQSGAPDTPLWSKPMPVWTVWLEGAATWHAFDGAELEGQTASHAGGETRLLLPDGTAGSLAGAGAVLEGRELVLAASYGFGLMVFRSGSAVLLRYEDTMVGHDEYSPANYPPLWVPPAAHIDAFSEDPSVTIPVPGMIEHAQQMRGQFSETDKWRCSQLREPALNKLIIKCKKAYKGCGLEQCGPVDAEICSAVVDLFARPDEEQPLGISGALLRSLYDEATGHMGESTPSGIVANALTLTVLQWRGRRFIAALETQRGARTAILDDRGQVYPLWRVERVQSEGAGW
eukprot:TRINITY_DN28745_c0_g1_i1.p1 TRINITY_DN28745_c0_g1~~TRINITY_DN28745_c0_g1_i1.p1  ORF type:complete len:887 (+),score=349.73 TRINITY_DN28745_c0_g1_i1:59-2662(+)